MIPASSVNITRLAAQVRAKRGDRGLRAVAQEISDTIGRVSASTLSRVEQGNVPDLDTFMHLCKWLNVSADSFSNTHSTEKSTSGINKSVPEEIEAHLRADRTLPPEAIDALSQMIRFAYNAVKEQKIARRKVE